MNSAKQHKWVILAAGGSGTRMNAGENKIFLQAGGISILLRSMLLFEGCGIKAGGEDGSPANDEAAGFELFGIA